MAMQLIQKAGGNSWLGLQFGSENTEKLPLLQGKKGTVSVTVRD